MRCHLQFSLRTLLLVTAFFGVYLGSYRLLLNPVEYVNESFGGMVVSGYRKPEYRFGGRATQVVYWPLAWVDHTIRPGYWDHYSDFDDLPLPPAEGP